jgi:AcrR family transcriptional regulator
MLVEQGYAAMTMKGIAERAKVGRQTVYRWWSTKAEILLEASAADAARELAIPASDDADADITEYLWAVAGFLTTSDAGLAYRALLGEAQHDRAVAELLRGADVLGESARAVIDSARAHGILDTDDVDALIAEMVGPLVFRILSEDWRPSHAAIEKMARRFLHRSSPPPGR